MAIEGPLQELALSDVFQLLQLSRKTGLLTVTPADREREAVVRFEGGMVVGARFSGSRDNIGHLLVRSGKATDSQIERALRIQRGQPSRPLGTILVDMGVVSEADVQRQVRFLVEETVFELLRWEDGDFRFEEAPPLDGDAVAIRVPVEPLLMEWARRMDEWTVFEEQIPDAGAVPVLAPDEDTPTAGAVLELEPSEWEVLAEIDGERSLKMIARELGRGEFEVAKMVYGLMSAGVVDIVRRRTARPGRAAVAGPPRIPGLEEAEAALTRGDQVAAVRLLTDIAAERGDHPEVHLALGRAHRSAGDWSAAAGSFAQAARLDPLSAPAHYHCGFAAARVGDLARAEEAWKRYLRLPDPKAERQQLVLRAIRAAAALRHLLEQEEM